jgi:predicted GNAT family N-acyltransferase
MTIEIKRIHAADTYALRHAILRPNQTLADCAYPCDHEPECCHIGAFEHGQLIGVGTIFPHAAPPQVPTAQGRVWQIRGMAVSEAVRGTGAGGKILQALLAHSSAYGTPCTIWCNGRVTVQGFYERFGFTAIGDVYEMPGIGPHLLFAKQLD